MLPDIPLLAALRESRLMASLDEKIHDPESQRRLVLIIVCAALFLDNMLYMVIVPIIPITLAELAAEQQAALSTNPPLLGLEPLNGRQSADLLPFGFWNATESPEEEGGALESLKHAILVKYTGNEDRDVSVGFLFASKALIQLFISPISGTIIDRVGYETPMLFGLAVIFLSTTIFAFGGSYGVLLVARSLQGVGSAFADTAGLAMIADRYKEEGERSKAQGIALAFISFGCLFAPPFGGFFYKYAGKAVPFLLLSLIALADGILLRFVMKPARKQRAALSEPIKGTPIYRLILDPYIAICAGALVMANVSLAFLEPTIARWMKATMGADELQIGVVWLPPFIPHVFGVYLTVKLVKLFPQKQWLVTAVGLSLEGFSCLLIPFCSNYVVVMVPLMITCFGIALVDTAVLPTLAYLVDVRHASVYGSVYAIADISYSLAYAFGPIVADWLYQRIGFTFLNIGICIATMLYAPILILLRNVYKYKPFEEEEEDEYININNYPESTVLKSSDKNHPSYVMSAVRIPATDGGSEGVLGVLRVNGVAGQLGDVNAQHVHAGRVRSCSSHKSSEDVGGEVTSRVHH